jgi:hypothetical protein
MPELDQIETELVLDLAQHRLAVVWRPEFQQVEKAIIRLPND